MVLLNFLLFLLGTKCIQFLFAHFCSFLLFSLSPNTLLLPCAFIFLFVTQKIGFVDMSILLISSFFITELSIYQRLLILGRNSWQSSKLFAGLLVIQISVIQFYGVQYKIMRTIKAVNSPTGKSVKKILLNRSRSGNQLGLKIGQAQDRQNFSPFRNSIGLKNAYQVSEKNKQNEVPNRPNQDYYQIKNAFSNNRNTDKECGRIPTQNIVNIQKKMLIKDFQIDKNKDEYGWVTMGNTKQNSKFSGSGSTQLKYAESEYSSTYMSPTLKLKKLQKQKYTHKQKAQQNLNKVIKTEQQIQQNRNCHRLQMQLYQQIIKKLEREKDVIRCAMQHQSYNNSSLKQSKSGETEEGETSNQF